MEYTKYEKARIIGSRALQISMGAPILVNLTKKDFERLRYNPIEMAKLELKEGLIPITVKRPYPKSDAEEKKKAVKEERQEISKEDGLQTK